MISIEDLPDFSIPSLPEIIPELDYPLVSARHADIGRPVPERGGLAGRVYALFCEWDQLGRPTWSRGTLRAIARRLNLDEKARREVGRILQSILACGEQFRLPSLWGDEWYAGFNPLLRCEQPNLWRYGDAGQERKIISASAADALRIAYELYHEARAAEIRQRAHHGAEKLAADPLAESAARTLIRSLLPVGGGVVRSSSGQTLMQLARSGRRFHVRVYGRDFRYCVSGGLPLWMELLGVAMVDHAEQLDAWPVMERINRAFQASLFATGGGWRPVISPENDIQADGWLDGCRRPVHLESQVLANGLWRLSVRRRCAGGWCEQVDATSILTPDRALFHDAYVVATRSGRSQKRQTWVFPQGEAALLLLFVLTRS